MTIEELRAQYDQAKSSHEEARRAADPYLTVLHAAARAEKEAELALLRAQGTSPANVAWIEAWLDGRHDDCKRIVESEEFRRELSEAWAAAQPQGAQP